MDTYGHGFLKALTAERVGAFNALIDPNFEVGLRVASRRTSYPVKKLPAFPSSHPQRTSPTVNSNHFVMTGACKVLPARTGKLRRDVLDGELVFASLI